MAGGSLIRFLDRGHYFQLPHCAGCCLTTLHHPASVPPRRLPRWQRRALIEPTYRAAMAAKIYTTKDAPIAPLKKKTLAVIGFGSQGHAHALNLKDSGLKVIVGLYPKSKSREVAKKLGFEVMDTAEAVQGSRRDLRRHAGHRDSCRLQQGHRAEPHQGQNPALLPRFCRSLQDDHLPEGCGRDPRRAERPRPHRALAVCRR